jgi:hypothetical protein
MTVRWIRVGHWLLAKTPIHGPRVYRLPTKAEEAQMLDTSWAPTDYELWGGHPSEIMADHVGKPLGVIRVNKRRRGKAREATDAGIATPEELASVPWTPTDKDDPGDKTSAGYVPLTSGWSLPRTSDPYTFSTSELVVRYHETKGEATIVCGYCEARSKSRDLRKLLKWFRLHPCISPYASASRD